MIDRYVLAEVAEQDLEEILLRIARDDLDTALRVDQEFYGEFFRLAENPLIGHTRLDLAPRYRVWHLYSYLIIYKPRTSPLEIVRIWHGARRTPRLP